MRLTERRKTGWEKIEIVEDCMRREFVVRRRRVVMERNIYM